MLNESQNLDYDLKKNELIHEVGNKRKHGAKNLNILTG